MKRILVAIPCYNCEKQIPRVLRKFDDRLLKRIEKVVLVDNCSTDNTVQSVTQTLSALETFSFELIKNQENYGLGGTHKVAFLRAIEEGFDYVAILHGDDQGEVDELNALLDAAENFPDCAAILGARFMPGSRTPGYSLIRKMGNIGLNFLYTTLSGRPTWDLGSGLNLFKVSELSPSRFLQYSDGFTFNMDLLLGLFSVGKRLRFVPITWSETDQRSNASSFKVGWIALKTLLKWRTGGAKRQQDGHPSRTYASQVVFRVQSSIRSGGMR